MINKCSLVVASILVASCVGNHSSKMEIKYSSRLRKVVDVDLDAGKSIYNIDLKDAHRSVVCKIVSYKNARIGSLSIFDETGRIVCEAIATKETIVLYCEQCTLNRLKHSSKITFYFNSDGNLLDVLGAEGAVSE